MQRRVLRLRPETIRHLTDMSAVVGGRPTSWPYCLGAEAVQTTQTIKCPTVACAMATSEAGGDGFPCPRDWPFTCKP